MRKVNGFLLFLVNKIMPERLIRILFISSIFSKLFKQKTDGDISKEHIEKLNSKLELSTGTGALELGMLLSNVIWCNSDKSREAINEIDLKNKKNYLSYIRIIKTITPKWLRYNYNLMDNDLRLLFNLFDSYLVI